MELTRSTNLPSLTERLHRLRTRIYLENVSGISASNREAFLAFCREQERLVDSQQNHLSDWSSIWPEWDQGAWDKDISVRT